MTEESLFLQVLKPITTYVLVPLWFAILIYIITEVLCIKKGISLRDGVHEKNFGLVAVTALLWLITFWIPERAYMPLNAISFSILFGIFATVLTLHFVVFYFSELFAPENTMRELGIGAGLTSVKHATTAAAKMCLEDEELAKDGTAIIMLTNTVIVLRNFAIIALLGLYLGILETIPVFFWVSMLAMGVICFVSHLIFNWKSQKAKAPEYSFFSPKNLLLSLLIFVVVYYLFVFAIGRFGSAGLYTLTGLTGFLYGGAPIFVVLALLHSGTIAAAVALNAAVIATMASIASNVFYSFLSGAKKLSIYLLISELIVISCGIVLMLLLV